MLVILFSNFLIIVQYIWSKILDKLHFIGILTPDFISFRIKLCTLKNSKPITCDFPNEKYASNKHCRVAWSEIIDTC